MRNAISHHSQFIRFLIVGVVNTLFGYGCFAALLYIGLHYALAGMISTISGVLFNFKSTGKAVFHSSDNRLIFRFVGVYCVTYCISTIGVGLFELIRITPYISGAIMLIPMALLSFYLNKHFVFKR